MKVDGSALAPWSAVNNHFTRMKRLKVFHGDDVLGPEFTMDLAEDGTLTLKFKGKPKAEPKGRKITGLRIGKADHVE